MKQLTLNFQNDMEPSGGMRTLSLPEGSRSCASRSASRASAKARRTTATSGRRCCGLFGLFDPVGSWARTFSELLIGRKEWSSTRCVLTWKQQDTKCSRTLYRLAVSALPTGGTDAGLLPTVQTQVLKQCEKGKTVFMPLELLPTPTANDAMNSSLPASQVKRKSGLPKMAMQSDEYQAGTTSRLNPLYVIEMMGFPVNWLVYPFLRGAGNPSKHAATP